MTSTEQRARSRGGWSDRSIPLQEQFRRQTIVRDVDEFLNTPVHFDPFARSKIPFALRLRGSVLGGMLPTLLLVGIWSSLVVYVGTYHLNLAVDSLLITVTGMVTSLALGFRVNSAYERYSEGRRFWAQLSRVVRGTSRVVWWSIPEGSLPSTSRTAPRPTSDEDNEMKIKEELLTKATAIRVLLGFAFALKHHLRGEFGTDWDDLKDLVGFLPTYGRLRSELETKYNQHPRRRRTGSSFSTLHNAFFRNLKPVSRSSSNKLVKATIAHGNLPLEILSFFGCYVDLMDSQGKLSPILKNFFMDQMNQLQDILAGCERVLMTPLPLAFNISIAQITWVFILLLPFQLIGSFKWATIPACLAAAYMLLGLSHLSFEIENPFGTDANDLPLDRMCDVLTTDVDVICAHRMSSLGVLGRQWVYAEGNKPLLPVVKRDFAECLEMMTIDEIREALRLKVERVSGETTAGGQTVLERGEKEPDVHGIPGIDGIVNGGQTRVNGEGLNGHGHGNGAASK